MKKLLYKRLSPNFGFWESNLRFKFFLFLLFVSPALWLSAQETEVNREELEQNLAPVEFINYTGPQDRIESLDQIRGIGTALGTVIRGGADQAGSAERYFVIHSVSPQDGDKLDADIFGLGIDVGVDHIRNLRLIIQGYLESAYEYSPQDAALLAEYVTVYNAVFRGTGDYFSGRYKIPVMENIHPGRAGISIRFDEWPGQTLMLIPLGTGAPGSLSALDTTILTSPEVVEELRGEDDRGIAQRKEMVDLKEREAGEAEQRAALQREAIVEEEARIVQERAEAAQERAAAAQERAEIAQERQQAQQAQAEGRAAPEATRQAEEQLAEREKALDQQEAEAAQREQDLDRQEQSLAEKEQEAQASEDFADRKIAEAQQERADIARDQQELLNRPPQGAGAGVVGVRLTAPNSPLGRIVRMDTDSKAEIKTSDLNAVNARTFTSLGGKLIAVAGENRGTGAMRLIEINPATLETDKQGNDTIAPDSLLWTRGNDLYAITSAGDGLYLGRFNTDLELQGRSTVTVHPFAALTFNGDSILTQRSDGSLVILDGGTLAER
ncbi:MAG: hypothetical protein LBD65_03690 [Spirochaetaceae bacterium]|jgi:hypothetical protein|nr:hypothetical protein [Spirochaetaceae bacterium]